MAKWTNADNAGGIKYSFDRANATADLVLLDVRNALYAFVQGDTVSYIGKTARSIKKRFIGYCTPNKSQRTNWRCHNKIKALLKEHKAIRILVFTPISQLRYGEFEIDLAAGLEEALAVLIHQSSAFSGRRKMSRSMGAGRRGVLNDADPGSIFHGWKVAGWARRGGYAASLTAPLRRNVRQAV